MALTSLASTALSQTAFNTVAYFPLRAALHYDDVADVKPDTLTNPGKTVSFDTFADLAAATTILTEGADFSAVAMSDSQSTVVLNEYGNAVQTTALARAIDLIAINPAVANVLGYNAGITQDTIARNAVQAGTNVFYGGAVASRVTVAAGTVITGPKIMQAVANLRTNNVQPWDDQLYRAIIHPLISYDLRQTVGAAGWNDVHVYSGPAGVFNGVVGNLLGVQFMETSRAPFFVDAGVGGTVDVYGTLFMGQQAIVKAFTSAGGYTGGAVPTFGDTPVVDTGQRFEGKYWKWCGGYNVFRQAALYRLETSSSMGAN